MFGKKNPKKKDAGDAKGTKKKFSIRSIFPKKKKDAKDAADTQKKKHDEKKTGSEPAKKLSLSSVMIDDGYLQQYKVGEATVTISKDLKYCVFEPQFIGQGKSAYEQIMAYKRFTSSYADEGGKANSLDSLMKSAETAAADLGFTREYIENYRTFQYYIRRNVFGFDLLDVLMHDPKLEDITCSDYRGTVGVIHQDYLDRHVLRTTIQFDSKEHMESWMERQANRAQKHISTATPTVDMQIANKYRMSLIANDIISPNSPAISVRIKSSTPITITHLLNQRAISPETVAVIWALLDVRGTGMIVGGTGSGKTSTIGSLLPLVRKNAKILTIEDTAELLVPHEDWLPLIVDAPISSERYFVKFEEVLNAALRQRPYMISVGEVRGKSTKMLFDAISTGHSSLSSFHAYSAAGAVQRIQGEMGVPAGSFTDLGFILSMAEVVTKTGSLERRCVSFDEVGSDGKTVSLINLGRYDAVTDSFADNSIDYIIKHSRRLRMASARDASTDIRSDLEMRIDLLSECQKQKAETPQKVMEILSRYYEKKRQ